MSKLVIILATVLLSAGTTWAKGSKSTVSSGDSNIRHGKQTDCGRLQPGLLGDSTNTPVKAEARAGSSKNGTR